MMALGRVRVPLLPGLASRLVLVLLVVAAWFVLSAHVGTNQVVFEGRAGGYPVRVMITPPGVVPAQVPILVRVLEGTPTRVTVRAAQWNVGTRGAPPAEDAKPVAGDPGAYAHDLWIMTSSSYAIYVAVEGPAGSGELLVPMQSASTRTLGMQRVMGTVLAVLGGALVLGFVTIVGAAAREGTLAPGERPDTARRRRAQRAWVVTTLLLGVSLFGGWRWWNAEEAAYRRSMYRPIRNEGSVSTQFDVRALRIAISDSAWRMNRYGTLLPDHGKLMHLFLVKLDDARVIAHLHPLRIAPDTFVTQLPPLPEGRYVYFGDVLFESGSQRTLVDTVDIPATVSVTDAVTQVDDPRLPELDADDAWRELTPVPLGTAAPLAGGGTMTLTADAPVREGRDLRLAVSVVDASGSASPLEPYMGMSGHAMIYRLDGGIFMHVHPMGTASMTAQLQLQRLEQGDSLPRDSSALAATFASLDRDGMHAMHGMTAPAFPFAFPTAGSYRVYVQVKRGGKVETAAFDVNVDAR